MRNYFSQLSAVLKVKVFGFFFFVDNPESNLFCNEKENQNRFFNEENVYGALDCSSGRNLYTKN